MNIAIIAAGGNGERMHTRQNKIFLNINGKPIIYYTLKTFSDYNNVDQIIITARKDNVSKLEKIISINKIKKVLSIEKAYDTRQESTYRVIEKLKKMDLPGESYLIIHNAVNPFVKHSELDKCLIAAKEYGASLLGFQAMDTVKIVSNNYFIDHTPERNAVWVAQTPQIIRFDIAIKAFEFANMEGFVATDDTTLVEAIHERVKFVECSRENFKITYPHDVELAKLVCLRRVKESNSWYV